jgi:proteic killer suppression protein
VEIKYDDDLLEKIATTAEGGGFAQAVVKSYRRRIQQITAAVDERDFYALKSLHYEKLKGNRQHQRSMKLNDQMRLILEIEASKPKNIIHVIAIEDYH